MGKNDLQVLFLHTRGRVLLAVAMHGTVLPGKDIAPAVFPTTTPVPDWRRTVVSIAAVSEEDSYHVGTAASAVRGAKLCW
jgi:hypothetical protein